LGFFFFLEFSSFFSITRQDAFVILIFIFVFIFRHIIWCILCFILSSQKK